MAVFPLDGAEDDWQHLVGNPLEDWNMEGCTKAVAVIVSLLSVGLPYFFSPGVFHFDSIIIYLNQGG